MTDTSGIEPGIHRRLSYAEYDAIPAKRHSRLWTLHTHTPAHYKYEQDHPVEEDTQSLRFGRAYHAAVLEPESFGARFAVGGPINDKTGRPYGSDSKKFQEWGESQKPLEPLTTDEASAIIDMAKVLREHPAAKLLLEQKADSEVVVVWIDGNTGLKCKGRIDWLPRGAIIVDLKSARSAAPSPFGRDAYNYGYVSQLAFYLDGLRQFMPDAGMPLIIAQEKDPPYAVAVYELSESDIELGRSHYRAALEKLAECERLNSWPAYSEAPEPLSLPPWAGMERDVATATPTGDTAAEPDLPGDDALAEAGFL